MTIFPNNQAALEGQKVTEINIFKPQKKLSGFKENSSRIITSYKDDIKDTETEIRENAQKITSFTDKNSFYIFTKAINTAKRTPRVLAVPDYYINILLKNNDTKGYYLWLNASTDYGLLMNTRTEQFDYKISKQSTAELKELLLP